MPEDNNKSKIIFYTTPDEKIKLEVTFEDETVWLSQKLIAGLFGVTVPTINEHLKNIFESGELEENRVIRNFLITAADGKKYDTKFYNLDAIISVGYRVNSNQATQFRIWATNTLREFILKGFVLDDDRLKNGAKFGKDYFEELLERIREIRASERRFYQKITDIFALSIDYNKHSETTKEFFATVQNKLHWAITGQTAPEIIHSHADSNQPHMGLTNWKEGPKGKILKSDVTTAKNYLNNKELKELDGVVSAYLDLAENRANRGILMKMEDWIKFLNEFLKLSDYPILKDKGTISKLQADLKAHQEFEKFRVEQDKQFESDFDKEVKRFLKGSKEKS